MSTAPTLWIIETGEPAAVPGEPVRKMRAAMLADELVSQGAAVTSWVSTWEHQQKRKVAEPGAVEAGADGITRRYLHGMPYHRNVSLARIRAQRQVAADFTRRAAELAPPDLIYCGYPTMDLAAAAVRYGRGRSVPVIVDIRDMWPDVFADLLPLPRPVVHAIVKPLRARARKTLSQASALYSITEPFLDFGLDLAGRRRRVDDRVFVHAYRRPDITPAERAAARDQWRTHGLKLDGSESIICFFGNLSELPNFQSAIAALDRLPEPLKDQARLVTCGVGDQYPRLVELGRRDPRIVAPGRVDRSAISVLMENASAGLLAYPPREDMMMSYPNKVGEYLSGPLPIIATLDGVTGRMLREDHCGIVVAYDDVGEMTDAMIRILGTPEGEAMKRAAANIYNRRFNAEQVYPAMAASLIALAVTPA